MLSGFRYNGLSREVELKPLIEVGDFRCFWSAPTGWGSFQLASGKGDAALRVEVSRGAIDIRQIRFSAAAFPARGAKLVVGKQSVPCAVEVRGVDRVLVCKQTVRVTATEALHLSVGQE